MQIIYITNCGSGTLRSDFSFHNEYDIFVFYNTQFTIYYYLVPVLLDRQDLNFVMNVIYFQNFAKKINNLQYLHFTSIIFVFQIIYLI